MNVSFCVSIHHAVGAGVTFLNSTVQNGRKSKNNTLI